MTGKGMALLVWLLLLCGTAYGKTDRWHKVMEDEDLTYFIDDRSITTSRAGTTVFWMKLASKRKDFLKTQYRMADLEYILFNYEVSCDRAMFTTRGVIYYDRNGNQIDKQAPIVLDTAETEPIPPESAMEVAQDYVCSPGDEPSIPQRQQVLPQGRPAEEPALDPDQAPELPSTLSPSLK